ncbi:MAG: signal recognition particle protein [Deltaproteobacteria bacterium]|nr:signal recognition particle protein [Deltaproteobacteria bacterium]
MFDALTSKLQTTFDRLRSRGRLTESDVDEALKEIRTALLEADVNFRVVKEFCDNVRKKCVGTALSKSLDPSRVIIGQVYEEIVRVLGTHEPLSLRHAPPVIIMLVGLQGSGKTTSCGKLARHLRDDLRRRVLLVPADVYRPAAIEQLKTLGRTLGIETFDTQNGADPVDIAKQAIEQAKRSALDTVILDTAGRLQIDEELMDELVEIIESVEPHEVLLALDAMTGQQAVEVAKGFDERLDIDGVILTKLDGDARGGAALSMRASIEKPIKFVGLGEKLDALDVFYPERMASRILGMGDMATLIEKATKQVDLEEAKKLEKKLKKTGFNFEDFHSQLQTIKKMGSITSLMEMVPGLGGLTKGLDESVTDKQFARVEAIILSMTREERLNPELLNGSRRKRIALGSGNSVEEVNRFLKQFDEMQKVMKKFSKLGPNAFRGIGGLGPMLKGGPRAF